MKERMFFLESYTFIVIVAVIFKYVFKCITGIHNNYVKVVKIIKVRDTKNGLNYKSMY